jgi:type I restriction enzyme, R subunit
MAVLVKTPERIRAVCEDIVEHFQTKVEPNGFKGQVVTFDRECCVLYKAGDGRAAPPEASAIVMTVQARTRRTRRVRKQYDRDTGRGGEAARPLPRSRPTR